MKKLLILLWGGCLLQTGQLQAQTKYTSLLWEISGKGMQKPSYLYGTMHVSRRVAFHLSDSFFIALNSAGIVALESNPELWLEAYNDPDMSSPYRIRGPEVSGPGGLYNDWFSINVPKPNTFRALLSRDPQIINGLLYRQNSYTKNFEEDTYLDLFIFQSGRKLGKQIASLEGLKESEELVDRAFLPDKESEDEKELKKVKKMMKDLDQNLYEMMEDAYRRGDLDMLDSVTTMMNPGKNYRKYMLDERNRIMARNMDSLMKKQVVFSAIGAAHLPGEMGVIELLRKMGYQVRPIVFTGARDSKMKDKIEKIRYPVTLRWNSPGDSSFSVQVPGKLIPIGGRWTKSYIFSDMANGSYYAVYRLLHMNAWTGNSPAGILARIDSMLFENIPGKIIKKEKFKTVEGYEGMDIFNKTKTGDHQRYRIIVTPTEVVLMKCAGTGDYISREKEVNTFFTSIRWKSSSGWTDFNSPQCGFKVKMPANVFRVNQPDPDSPKNRTEEKLVGTDPDGDRIYLAMSTSCHDFNYLEHDSFELRVIAYEFLESNKFEEHRIKVQAGNEYSSFSGKKEGKHVRGRVYIRGTSYYLFAVYQKDSTEPAGYFSSIQFSSRVSPSKIKSVNDTSLYFSVTTTLEPSGSPYDRMLYGSYYKPKQKKTDESHREESRDNTYADRHTREGLHVRWIRLHKYEWEDTLQHLFDEYIFKGEKDKARKAERWKARNWESNGIHWYEFYRRSTDCGVSLYRRVCLKGGAMWVISAVADSAGQFSPGVKAFLDSFQPADTVFGKAPYEDKAGMLLADLLSKDSLTRDHAERSVMTVYSGFTDSHFASLSAYFKTAEYYKQEISKRADLVSALGKMKKTQPVGLLKELFLKAGDTASLQLAALEGLLRLGTKEGNTAFIEMMKLETPLVSGNDNWLISSLFHQAWRNMDVARHLFPGLLEFARYPEYKEEIYSLLAELQEKKKIGAEVILGAKGEILRNARDELKRQLYKEEEMKGDFVDSYRRYSWLGNYTYGSGGSEFLQYGNRLIYDYARLLAPYYKETGVKDFFHRLHRTRNAALKIAVYSHLVEKKVQLPDSVWKELGNTPANRLVMITWLNKIKRPDLIPDAVESDSLLVQAFAWYYQNMKPEDSLVPVSSDPLKNKLGPVNLHLFKFKEKKELQWEYFGIMTGAKDSTGLPLAKFLTASLYGIEYQNDDEESGKELRKQAVLFERERSAGRYFGGDLFGDLYNPDYEE